MTALSIPNITLKDGKTIPQLGLGVFLVEPGETERIVSEALEVGYRHIDTAKVYENEAEVGRAIAKSGIPRDELFITTKLWNSDQEDPQAAFDASMDRLGLERVDLYLIHWPVPEAGTALGAWKGLIDIAATGRATTIGVSNFEIPHLQQLLDETDVVPAVNQVELHPFHQRRELREFCRERGITIEAWGPLAQGKSDLLERPEIVEAAAAHGKTPAQVVLRWHLQHNTIIFPKTSRRERMIENAALFDFELTAAEMSAIDALDEQRSFRTGPSTPRVR
jgi:2,5-diketo-D-gluconate reductase A